MIRYGLTLLLALGLSIPVWAGELDAEHPGKPAAPAVSASEDVVGVPGGREMDRESPTQACWGGGGYTSGYWGGGGFTSNYWSGYPTFSSSGYWGSSYPTFSSSGYWGGYPSYSSYYWGGYPSYSSSYYWGGYPSYSSSYYWGW